MPGYCILKIDLDGLADKVLEYLLAWPVIRDRYFLILLPYLVIFLSMYSNLAHMIYCPQCNKPIDDDSNYCYFCKTPIITETSKVFVYNLLFSLMQLEETRRQDLDSKAATYIGLLSVGVSVLTAFGGIIILRGGTILEIKNLKLASLSFIQNAVYLNYIFIVVLFILAVICAFLAYSTGSKKTKSNDSANLSFDEKKKCYQGLGYDYVACLSNEPLYLTYDKLIRLLREAISINYNLNNDKSNKIKDAFWITIFAISLLLVQAIAIGLIGMNML